MANNRIDTYFQKLALLKESHSHVLLRNTMINKGRCRDDDRYAIKANGYARFPRYGATDKSRISFLEKAFLLGCSNCPMLQNGLLSVASRYGKIFCESSTLL